VATQSKSFKNRRNYLHQKKTTPSQTDYDGESGSTVVSESKILGLSLENHFELLVPHTTRDTKGNRHAGANIPSSSKGIYTIGRHETANLQGCHQINTDICGADVVFNK
jgi:hypothetical protein